MTHNNPHPRYRADIDGLRAIAILSVVIFHAFPQWLPGGFVGVDVFFVISGYLISGIIMGGLAVDDFSFADFYARRIKRIFPALTLVLLACLAFSWMAYSAGWLFVDTNMMLGKHTAAGAAFIANLVYWRESGYFDPDVTMKPLVHLWSLGVEEQFYIVWPPVLLLARRLRCNLLLATLLLAAISFIANIALVDAHETAAFYLPVTRFWELLAGAALAYWHGRTRAAGTDKGGLVAALLSWLGLLLIVAALALIKESKPFPGYWALIPIAGAFLLIAAGPTATINRHVLGNRVAVFFGKISYPLYLWHWPLLSFAWIIVGQQPPLALRAGIVGAAIALAWLTYQLVEKPVRFSTHHSALKVAVLSVLMTLICAGGLLTWHYSAKVRLGTKQEYTLYFNNDELHYVRGHDLATTYRLECDFYNIFDETVKPGISSSCYTPGPGKHVFLWGDSHAQSLTYGIKSILPPGVSLLQVTTSGCSPAIHNSTPDNLHACNKSNRFALQQISKIKPDLVIMEQHVDHEKTDWPQLAAELKKRGAKAVLVLGPLPQWKPNLWKVVVQQYWEQTPQRIATNHDPAAVATNAKMDSLYGNGKAAGFTYVSVIDDLCNAQGCIAYTAAGPQAGLMCFDYGHLTSEGSLYVARQVIAPVMQNLLNDDSSLTSAVSGRR